MRSPAAISDPRDEVAKLRRYAHSQMHRSRACTLSVLLACTRAATIRRVPPRATPTAAVARIPSRREALLGAFARRAEALTRGERSADAEPAASAAAAGSGSQIARPTAASAKADASRRAGPASGVPKAARLAAIAISAVIANTAKTGR